jgi:small subunit ribosomal protein S20
VPATSAGGDVHATRSAANLDGPSFLLQVERRRPVANIKSQIKRNRQNEARRMRNKAVRSELKTRRKNAEAAAGGGDDNAAGLLQLAVKRIDMAAAKGVIHKNKAARDKSRLMRRIAQLNAAD